MNDTKKIIKKWYEALNFPNEFDGEFYKALDSIPIESTATVADYDPKCEDGAKNLLSFLYFSEALEKKYEELGIPRDVLLDTLNDIVVWTKEWTAIKGKLALGTLDWLSHHMNLRIFRIGRLQFYPTVASMDIDALGVKAGEDVLDVHIPAIGRLTKEECELSFEGAKNFFARLYPEKDFKCFVCHSWLLDETLKKYLPKESNIVRFGDMFIKLRQDDDNALIRYMFPWDTTMENLPLREGRTSSARRIKDAVLSGEQFHVTLGARAL